MEQTEIEEMVKELEEATKMAFICGGTVSSINLKIALKIREVNTNETLKPRIDEAISTWRKQLKVHNDQPQKVFEYNIETGEQVV